MSFEELQSIWNSQQSQDAAVDRAALMNWVKARHRSFTRLVGVTEIVMTLTLLFMAAMFMRDPVLQGHDRILAVAGIGCTLAAGFVWTGRVARKKREIRYDTSLLGIVDRSIDAIDYQIRRMRGFLWWFAGPASLGLVIALFIIDDAKRYLLYAIFIPAFVVCMSFAWWQIRREIRCVLIPDKTRLEELRSKLVSD